MSATCDVAIVGAGPTGAVLAILLAQQGHSVVLLEKQGSPYPLPRAVHFDHEVGRILQACGIGAPLREIIESAEVYEWRNAAGRTLLRFGRRGDGLSGWPQASMFNQPDLEGLLATRVGELPEIDLRRSQEVTGFETDDDGVTVRHRPAGNDVESTRPDGADTIRCQFLIGCDGANSTVRTQLGIDFEDLGFFFDWLVVDMLLHTERVYDPINLQVCDPRRPTTAVSGGPGRRRWEFMRLPEEDLADLSGDDAAWRLLAPWDVHPGNSTMVRHANYTFRARWAQTWRSGRVLLAGDAAHQMPPFAGQGMCSGSRDAANLAWKLDLLLRGLAADSILDTYQTERMPNVAAVVDFSIELGKIICMLDPVEAAGRDEFMSAMVVADEVSDVPPLPGITDGVIATGSELAGSLFLQGLVDDGRGPRPFDAVVGVGFRLVSTVPITVAVDAELLAWFATIGGKVVVIGEHGMLGDPGGDYAHWFERHGVVAVLQRPDFVIFGAAPSADAVESLLANLRTALNGDDGR